MEGRISVDPDEIDLSRVPTHGNPLPDQASFADSKRGVWDMAIAALYPSRRHQSHKNNPLFARERRQKRLIAILATGFGLLCFVGLRIPPGTAPAEAGTASVHAVAVALSAAPKRQVRIIPLYAEPGDAGIATPANG